MSALAYLDYNAGAPVRPEVVSAMVDALSAPGNPSSVHGFGRRARALLERARTDIASVIGADPAGLVFTSGGTEANALALRGTGRKRILISAVEHASVRDCGIEPEIIPVRRDGRVDLEALDRLLAADPEPALVSVMLANNETGVIQPIAEIARIARTYGALVHCDGAQALGRLSVSMSDLDVDFLTLSAHKAGGPAGIGCLATTKADFPLAPFLLGGGQEKRRRAGTENLAGIAGFAAAALIAGAEVQAGDVPARMKDLRDRMEAKALSMVPEAAAAGAEAPRLCNTSCLILPGIPAQLQVMAMDLAGVMVSAGAACSSGKVEIGHVLPAMGYDKDSASGALRVSLGPDTSEEDVTVFLAAWADFARRKGLTVKDAA